MNSLNSGNSLTHKFSMTLCEENCTRSSSSMAETWADSIFVLMASCTTTVAAALNLGLFASIIIGGVAAKHPITLQLCTCAVIACAALSCHIQQVWSNEQSRKMPQSVAVPCRALGLATLFSHCAFITLLFMELRFANRRVVIRLLAVISWCVTAIVTLAAGANCTPSSTILVFCFYVLHIPLVALLILNQTSTRSIIAPLGVAVALRPPDIRRIVPQVLLFFIGTMPQAFLTAVEALDLKPFYSADAWCSLVTAFFAVLRPLLDTVIQPELGDVTAELIGTLCWRRKRLKQISPGINIQ